MTERDWFDWIGLIVGVIGAAGLLTWWLDRREAQLKERIASPAYRHAEITAHRCTRPERYRAGQRRLLDWLQRRAGGIWSVQSFGTCLTLAYLYPVAGAFLGWIVSGQTTLGGLELFQDVESRASRLLRLSLLLAALAILARVWPKLLKMPTGVALLVKQRIHKPHQVTNLPQKFAFGGLIVFEAVSLFLANALYKLSLFFIAVVAAGVVVYAVVSNILVFGDIVGTVIVTLVVAGFILNVVFGFYVFFGVSVVAGFGSVFGQPNLAALTGFVWLLLPILNALADYLSLNVTRCFLTAASNKPRSAWWLVSRLVLDLIFGLACLALLLFTLRYSLDLWASLSPETLPLDWRAYWANATQDWTQGIALWTMCLTTLVPTFVHVIWGFVHWQTAASQHTQDAVTLMAAQPPDAKITDNAVLTRVANDLRRGRINAALRVAAGTGAFAVVSAALILAALRIFG